MTAIEVLCHYYPLYVAVFQSMLDEPIHILNVAIKTDSDTDDDGLAASFREFTQSKVSGLSPALHAVFNLFDCSQDWHDMFCDNVCCSHPSAEISAV